MARSGRTKKRIINPDPIYGSRLLSKLINRSMRDGKKSIAQKQVYEAMKIMAEKMNKDDALEIVRQALDNIKPLVEVRSRRIGGAAYQVPMPVKGDRRETLAIRWLVNCARLRPNKEYRSFGAKLAAEMMDAIHNQGLSVKKRDDTHRAAEANKAFAHFRW